MLVGSTVSFAQSKADARAIEEARRLIRQEISELKGSSALRPDSTNVINPADLNEQDSFGKNVVFLGSGYAGSVFIAPSCSPPDVPANLAPDDKCVVKPANQSIPPTLFTDPAWQITIPGKSVKNVIYLLINNNVATDNVFTGGAFQGGSGSFNYSLQVTLVSSVLNDPSLINPLTGDPFNGSFTSGLQGGKSRTRAYSSTQPDTEFDSYASVTGRGISRLFFRNVGLAETVIDNIFKNDITLKFGLRAGQSGAVASGNYFYTYRLVGQ